jgi:nuclease S1
MSKTLVVGVLAALASVAALPQQAQAWSAEGHRIVCEIAWERLTPQARWFVTGLLRDEADPVFARTCAWADEVRSTTHTHTAAYHYINIPAGADGVDLTRDCGDPERRCVTWAIRHYALRLIDSSLPHGERNEALKFLSHFVGDLHQPLHAGRPEDLGGNRVFVNFFGDAGRPDRPLNLHSVWDGAILRRGGHSWPESASRLNKQIEPQDVQKWEELDLIGWTNESFCIADEFAYGRLPAGNLIGNAYFRPALGYSESRLQMAGVRLAYLLNQAAAGTLTMPPLPL